MPSNQAGALPSVCSEGCLDSAMQKKLWGWPGARCSASRARCKGEGAKMSRYQKLKSVRLQTIVKAEDLARQIDAMQKTFFTTKPGEKGNIPGDISIIPRPRGKPVGYIDLPAPENYYRLEVFVSNEADDDMRAEFEALIQQLLVRL